MKKAVEKKTPRKGGKAEVAGPRTEFIGPDAILTLAKGDLFAAIKDQEKIMIAHVCNDGDHGKQPGIWGAGFVIPLGKTFPVARERYLADRLDLGFAQIVPVDNNKKIYVANMIAQRGVGPDANGRPPLRYASLCSAMMLVAAVAKIQGCAIHAPKFGAGLAGGNWDFILALIQELWADIPTTIYSLE